MEWNGNGMEMEWNGNGMEWKWNGILYIFWHVLYIPGVFMDGFRLHSSGIG